MGNSEAGKGMEKDRNSSYMLNNVVRESLAGEGTPPPRVGGNSMRMSGEEHPTHKEKQDSGPEGWGRLLRTAGWTVWLEWRRAGRQVT